MGANETMTILGNLELIENSITLGDTVALETLSIIGNTVNLPPSSPSPLTTAPESRAFARYQLGIADAQLSDLLPSLSFLLRSHSLRRNPDFPRWKGFSVLKDFAIRDCPFAISIFQSA